MTKHRVFSILLMICTAFSSFHMHCSQQQPQNKNNGLQIHKALRWVAVTAMSAAAIGAAATCVVNSFHVPKESLPTNPAQHLSTAPSIDKECFGFSWTHPDSSIISVSPVYSPEDSHEAIAEAKKNPFTKVHWYNCKYYNHTPYKKRTGH